MPSPQPPPHTALRARTPSPEGQKQPWGRTVPATWGVSVPRCGRSQAKGRHCPASCTSSVTLGSGSMSLRSHSCEVSVPVPLPLAVARMKSSHVNARGHAGRGEGPPLGTSVFCSGRCMLGTHPWKPRATAHRCHCSNSPQAAPFSAALLGEALGCPGELARAGSKLGTSIRRSRRSVWEGA